MHANPKVVVTCYDILDIMYIAGIGDLTDGKYPEDQTVSYDEAQDIQANYLLDQIGCKKGSRVLDVGCGYGRVLRTARSRGATATGITISPTQITRLNAEGLDAQLLNYRDIPESWNGMFDGIIANGSIEHFVQPNEVINGHSDELYTEMFAIFHRILKPDGKVATTVIHQTSDMSEDPTEVSKKPSAHVKGSNLYHFSKLAEDFGGWYPTPKQLIQASEKHFNHIAREDGTNDYHLTSEYWLKEARKSIFRPKVVWAVIKMILRYPRSTISMIDDLLLKQSWMWQFRKDKNGNTPTKLYRDTWVKRPSTGSVD